MYVTVCDLDITLKLEFLSKIGNLKLPNGRVTVKFVWQLN